MVKKKGKGASNFEITSRRSTRSPNNECERNSCNVQLMRDRTRTIRNGERKRSVESNCARRFRYFVKMYESRSKMKKKTTGLENTRGSFANVPKYTRVESRDHTRTRILRVLLPGPLNTFHIRFKYTYLIRGRNEFKLQHVRTIRNDGFKKSKVEHAFKS